MTVPNFNAQYVNQHLGRPNIMLIIDHYDWIFVRLAKNKMCDLLTQALVITALTSQRKQIVSLIPNVSSKVASFANLLGTEFSLWEVFVLTKTWLILNTFFCILYWAKEGRKHFEAWLVGQTLHLTRQLALGILSNMYL